MKTNWLYTLTLSIWSIVLYGQPNANFTASQTKACANLQVNFFDQSTSNSGIISWEWDLGGIRSGKQNPGRIFNEPGSYTICLTIKTISGEESTLCKENFVEIFENPTADFDALPSLGCVPLQVSFMDLSSSPNGEIVNWTWDVGGSSNVITDDGSLINISTTYDFPDLYSASLTIKDEKGCTHSITKSEIIEAQDKPRVDIEISYMDVCELPAQVGFNNLNIEPGVIYFWDFGNGETFVGEEPLIIDYDNPGVFPVSVIGLRGECRDTFHLQSDIIVKPRITAISDKTEVCLGQSVQFMDRTRVDADSLRWLFGDGESSTQDSPTYTFQDTGCYTTYLIRFFNGCTDTFKLDPCIKVHPLPEPQISISQHIVCELPHLALIEGQSSIQGSELHWTASINGKDTSFVGPIHHIPINGFGTYPIELQAISPNGCASSLVNDILEVKPFEASLPFLGPQGCAPATILLSDSIISEIPIDHYSWNISGPNTNITSNDASPNVLLSEAGEYNVSLVVTSDLGCQDTLFASEYIRLGSRPEVEFDANPLDTCAFTVFEFFDLSSNNVNEWMWEFGDGDTSYLQNPTHMYQDTGFYTVSLTSFHHGCPSKEIKEDFIHILGPIAKISKTYNCEDPYTVHLVDQSIDADTIFWTVEIDSVQTDTIYDLDFNYTFSHRGRFPLQLTAFNYKNGCEYIRFDTLDITDPVALFSLDTLLGCVPLTINVKDESIDAISWQYIAPDVMISIDTLPEPVLTFQNAGAFPGPELTVTDIHECTATYLLPDSIFANRATADYLVNESVCIPDSFEVQDLSQSLYGEILHWDWSIPELGLSSTNQNLEAYLEEEGRYSIILNIEDSWGCVDNEIKEPAFEGINLVVDFIADTLSCTWNEVRFRNKSTGKNIQSHFWDFGDGETSSAANPNHFYKEEGVYTVCLTVTEEKGCNRSFCREEYVKIRDPKALFSADPREANCPPLLVEFENLSENAFVYIWTFGDQSGRSTVESPSHVYTRPGQFDVQLIAKSIEACQDTIFQDDYILLEGPVGSFEMDQSGNCTPLRIDLLGEAEDPSLFIWDLGEGTIDSSALISLSDSIHFDYSTPGIYIPRMILVDTANCARSFTGDPITVNDLELDFEVALQTFCDGPFEVSLSNLSSSSADHTSYSWVISGPENRESNDQNPTFNFTLPGKYHIQLFGESLNCQDSILKQDFLILETTPSVDFIPLTNQQCESVEVGFENTSSNSFGEFVEWAWDFGDGHQSSEFEPFHIYEEVKNYTVTLTGITRNGCKSSSTHEIEVLPNVFGLAGPDQIICLDQVASLQGFVLSSIEGQSFYWLDDPTLSCTDCLKPIASPQDTTEYYFVMEHPNGCLYIDTTIIYVAPDFKPIVSLSTDTTICNGGVASIEILDFDLSQYSYTWDPSEVGLNCYSNCAVIEASPQDTTTYHLSVTNEFGCVVFDSIEVFVELEVPPILDDSGSVCKGDTIHLNIDYGSIPEWMPDPSLSCLNCPNPIASPTDTTDYIVQIISENQCPFLDTIRVAVLEQDDIDAGIDSTLCRGESITLQGSGPGQLIWSPSRGLANPMLSNTNARPDSTTTYTLTATEDRCVLSDSVKLEVIQKLEIEAIGDTICPGELALLAAEGNAELYTWTISNESELLSTESLWNLSPSKTTLYQVIGSKRICTGDTAFAQVFVHPEIELNFDDFLNAYDNFNVQINIDFDPLRNYAFNWDPPIGLTCTSCPNPTVQLIDQSLEYFLNVVDLDSGCMIDTSVYVRYFDDCTDEAFFVPNVFSPNGDHINDEIRVFPRDANKIKSFRIFDRWGSQLFFTEDVEKGWDGIYQGEKLNPGVYPYVVSYQCEATGQTLHFAGDITLLR